MINRSKLAGLLFISAAWGCYRPLPEIEPVQPAPEADASYFSEHPLMVPVESVSPRDLTDSFNAPRGNGRTHRAIDILAPRGTPVVAAIDGSVLRLAQSAAGGIAAYLVDDARRYVYYYAHLERYADAVTEGLRVPKGFVIGYVGTSGNAPPGTPHLHFQVMRLADGQRDWWNGPPVDALRFMTETGRSSR